MINFLETLYNVKQMVLLYAAMSLKPRIKDAMLEMYFPAQTAVTMLRTTTAAQMQKNHQAAYPNDPARCKHPQGLRRYGAAGLAVHICDQCGGRWYENTDKERSLIQCTPKASPLAKTPLGVPKHLLKSGYALHPEELGRHRQEQASRAAPSQTTSRTSPSASRSRVSASSLVGSRPSLSQSMSQARPKTRPAAVPMSARLTHRNLELLEEDDASMGSWDQAGAQSLAYSPSMADPEQESSVRRGEFTWQHRRRSRQQEEPVEEELILGEHGEHMWQNRPIPLTDEEDINEAEEEEDA